MTTTNPPEPRSWRLRTAMWLGHYNARLHVAALTILGASFLIAVALRNTDLGSVRWMFVTAGTIPMMVALFADICEVAVHRQNVCARDPQQFLEYDPDDEKMTRIVHAAHASTFRGTIMAGSFVLMVAGIVVSDVARDRGVPLAALIAAVPYMLLIAAAIWNVRVIDTHRWLGPLCPLCGPDDGPDDDDGPDPEPEPTPPPSGKNRIRA